MSQAINNNTVSLLLEAKHISHNFDYPLFKDINISLNPQESIAIMGVSGSGKSSLLNILCSLLEPNQGNVYFNNKDIFELSSKKLLAIRRKEFGIIFQAHYLFRGFTAEQNLQIASLLSKNNIEEDLLKELKIDHIISQGVGELSGGQQQRLSIARVLVKQPKIIFADEPTGNLDKQTANEVMQVLHKYIKEKNAGMIIVTHEDKIAYSCDKVYMLNDNKLEQIK